MTIETTVDATVAEREAAIAKMQAELSDLKAKQAEEREAHRKERFSEMLGGPSQVTEALSLDWDALDALGIIGFQLVRTDHGADLKPITAAVKTSTSAPAEGKRDLDGNFRTHATEDEKRKLASIMQLSNASEKNNKSYQLKVKVWKRVNE